MLLFQIDNYEDFKSIFGTRANGGRLMNKVLLSFWKYRFKIDDDKRSASTIHSLDDLYLLIRNSLVTNPQHLNYCSGLGTNGWYMYSNILATRGNGLDLEDKRLVCLHNYETGKEVKMKAGKFFRQILAENKCRLDESTIIYCSELFQQNWEAFSGKHTIGGLCVDKKFDDIYSSSRLAGSVGSCMVDKHRGEFYKKNVNASAAYLVNGENRIIARCIIYHNVKTADGKLHNYAERQYSIGGSEALKKILVNKLLEEGHIDLYKTVGAGCRDVRAILDAEGHRLANPNIEIPCEISRGDTLSFMDTFRYYYPRLHKASNYPIEGGGRAREIDHTTEIYEYDD